MIKPWTWAPLRASVLAAALWLPFGCSSQTETEPQTDPGAQTTTDGETAPGGAAKSGDTAKTAGTNGTTKNGTTKKTTPTGGGATTAGAVTVPESISDLAYIPPNAVAVLSFRPQTVLQSEMVKLLGQEQQVQLGMGMVMVQGMTGVDPKHIERLSIVVWPGESDWAKMAGGQAAAGPQFDGAAFIRLSQPVTLDQIKQSVAPNVPFALADAKAGAVTYAYADGENAPPVAVAVPNDRLIVIGTKGNIGDLLANKARKGGLLEKVAATDMDQTIVFAARLEPVRDLLQQVAAGAPKLPDAPDAEQLASEIDGLTLAAHLDGGLKVHFQLDAAKPATVQELKQQFDQWRGQLDQSRGEMVNQFAQRYDQELAGEVKQVADQVFESLQAKVDGDMLNVSVTVPKSAIDVAQKLSEIEAKQAELRNNAKQFGLALHNYHDVQGKFPFPGVVKAGDAAAQPLLSWRVAILPYIEQQPLYDQFKLDEPWDSEHNKALVEKMPDIFKLSDQAKPGHTQYLAVSGEGMIVDGAKSHKMADVKDGTSNTVWLVTVKPESAVPWTKPEELQVDPADVAKAMQKLGGVSGGFLAGFVDGVVRVLDAETLSPETFKKLAQIADGQPIDRSEFDPGFNVDAPALDFGPEPPPQPGNAVQEAPPTK